MIGMVLDATSNCHLPIPRECLSGWHAALFLKAYSVLAKIKVAGWGDQTQHTLDAALVKARF